MLEYEGVNLQPIKENAVSTGTTIIAVAFPGGVVMGADSRTSTGQYVANRASDKITPIHDSIYCCRSGSAADTQAISDYVRHYLSMHAVELGTTPQVSTAANLFKLLVYGNKDNLLAGIICAGWDPRDGGSVYSINLGGSMVKQPYAISGSGSTFLYGYCDAQYKEGMTEEECKEFVKNCVALAQARDGSSGGVIRVVTITKDGVNREFVPGDKLPFAK
eukprot:GILI01001157.1.p1 GENE.GILI01001157.1~~GILI01001157.1.p1  ORF type:complete len:243 (+),score=82.87 GILI01001157.1:74-730(+)